MLTLSRTCYGVRNRNGYEADIKCHQQLENEINAWRSKKAKWPFSKDDIINDA